MWLDWRLRNVDCQWTSVFLEHGGRLWWPTVAVDSLEEWILVYNTRSGMMAPNHIETCRPTWRFWRLFAGGPEANAFPSVGVTLTAAFWIDCNFISIHRRLYSNQMTDALVQAALIVSIIVFLISEMICTTPSWPHQLERIYLFSATSCSTCWMTTTHLLKTMESRLPTIHCRVVLTYVLLCVTLF